MKKLLTAALIFTFTVCCISQSVFAFPFSNAFQLSPIQPQNVLQDNMATTLVADLIINEFDGRGASFSKTLYENAYNNGGDLVFWDGDIPQHIRDGIIDDDTVKECIDYVISQARIHGSYKVDYISDNSDPTYNEPSFNETIKNKAVEFTNQDDLALAIHGINGHLVVDAVDMGNGEFDVWVSFSDVYDFDFKFLNCYNDALVCVGNNASALMEFTGSLESFTVTLGFNKIITP